MTAVGGFVDISELVFAAKAGLDLRLCADLGVRASRPIGIIVFGEMSGRVAAVAKQPVFNLMRHRLGLKLGLVTLVASVISTLITCAAEVGGVALILNYLTGAPYLLMAVASVARADGLDVGPAVQVDRAYLRPARPVDDRLRGRAGRDPPAVGQDRRRLRAAGAAAGSAPRRC